MKFVVESDVFDALPTMCVGVVVAKGIDNRAIYPGIAFLLDQAIAQAEERFKGKKTNLW